MTTDAPRILIAEDDEFIKQLLAAHFETAGFRVNLAGSGRELLSILDSESMDLLVLDLGLPDEDGLVLMRQVRARSTIPVIVLTARKAQEARISALELGADDYLTKPCDPRELVLRMQNLLKRIRSGTGDSAMHRDHTHLSFDGWSLDLTGRALRDAGGIEVHLSRSEYNLLLALANAPNRVLSRQQLLDAVCQNDSSPSERMIDVLIARLRRKLESDPSKPQLIKTMVGVGYKLTATVHRDAAQ